MRHRCKTDLWFLAKDILALDLVESTHRPICEHFVQKDPATPFHELNDAHRRRLLLYPRYSFKSSINIVDTLQWIICYPDIRIMTMCAVEDLSILFLEELKEYFILREGAAMTPFQQLFPEHIVKPEDAGVQGEFITPARSKYIREPTVWATSMQSTLPGRHGDIFKLDDAITDKSCETEQQRDKAKRKITAARKLIASYGFMDVVGTRWHPDDYYGYMIDNAQALGVKVLCKPARWLKPASLHRKKEFLTRDDYEFLFQFDASGKPQLTHEFLAKEEEDDPRSFAYQYLNDVSAAANLSFDIGTLRSRTRPPTDFPTEGLIVSACDWASTANSQSNYSVIVTALIQAPSNIYVLDIRYGKWQFRELAYQIVKNTKDWSPQRFIVEKSPGFEGLRLETQRQALSYNADIRNVAWFDMDSNANAKVNRIRALAPMFAAGRLFLSNQIHGLDKVYDQFLKFTGEAGKKRLDDIPDAIAFLLRFVSNSETARPLTAEEKNAREQRREDAMYRALFPDVTAEVEEETPEPALNTADIFGNNGLY